MRGIYGYDANGNPVYRDSTPAEEANILAVLVKVQTALNTNATYLAHAPVPAGTLTTAQLSAIIRILSDQTDALTHEVNALIRFLRGSFSDVSDT